MGTACSPCQATTTNTTEIVAPQTLGCPTVEQERQATLAKLPSRQKTSNMECERQPTTTTRPKEPDLQSQLAKSQTVDNQGTHTSLTLIQNYLNNMYDNAVNRKPTTQSSENSSSPNLNESNLEVQKLRTAKSVSGDRLKFRRDSFVRLLHENVNTKYTFVTKLGEGTYGCVFRCIAKDTKQERAIKVIRKKAVKNTANLFAELEILRTMDHPNIVKLFEIFEYNQFFYVVTEYCSGGELFEYVRSNNRMTERTIATIMKQILSGVKYMHQKHIVHRDLKPENIVMEYRNSARRASVSSSTHMSGSKGDIPPIKIIDFGTAVELEPGKFLVQKVGSPYYVAPQVLELKYNEKCDLWSCGVILYTLLSGSPPFKGHTQQEIFDNIRRATPSYEERVWPKVSPEARDLLNKLLQRNPAKRISAEQALEHKWIADCGSLVPIDQTVLSNLERFYFRNKFLAVVETYLAVNTVSQEDRRALADKFQEIDKDNSGVIEYDELLECFRHVYGSTYSEQTIRQIIANIDSNGSGKIDFTEFIVAIHEKEKLYQRNALESAFSFFDKDSTGFIEIGQLKELLGNSSEEQVLAVMNTLDADKDRRISKKQFVDRLLDKKQLVA